MRAAVPVTTTAAEGWAARAPGAAPRVSGRRILHGMTHTGTARFPVRFDPAYRVLSSALLLLPSDSFVEIEGGEVRVRMAWGFRARFPRSAVTSATDFAKRPLSRGVHGFAGRWLVNGSGDGIVRIVLEPRQRAWVMGFPVRLRELLVSVESPADLRAALAG
jgi:hypothetical protein